MPNEPSCRQCGRPLPGGVLQGVCPLCSFQNALKPATAAPGPVPQPSTPGAQPLPHFGDYELLELLARGGMGIVYKARQVSLDRQVALKMIGAGVLATPAEIKRFHAEAEAIAQLHHPNIVAIHEIGQHDGQHFFSMDYVAGRTLAEIVRDGPLPAPRAATYIKTIAEAVHYAHQHGIIHRDLKPANVLIDEQDQPRITDFGLAKRLSDSQLSTLSPQLTLSGQVLGSPNYLPPEQADPKRGGIGPPSDVYALGAVLYHLLTGRPPFQAESLTTLLREVIETDPVAPRSLNPSLPKDLETICLKCLEKETVRRYAGAQAVADELGRFLRGEPIRARPVTAAVKAWKWCRARPALAGVSAGLALTLVIGLMVALWQLDQTRASELAAEQNAYAADMKMAQAAVEQGDLGAAMNLLNAHRPAPGHKDFRGWEWRYLWQRCRGDELFVLTRSVPPPDRLVFSPDGRWLALGGARKNNLELWDIRSRQRVFSLPVHGYLNPFAFSLQGDLLAYATAGTQAVSVVRLDSRQEIARLPHTNNMAHLAFSADAARLFTFTDDGTLIEWDVGSKQPLRSFSLPALAFAAGANTLACSSDGRVMAFCLKNGISLYGLDSGRQTNLTLAGTEDSPTALTFSEDGKFLAVGIGGVDSEVYVWPAEDLWQCAGVMPKPRVKCGKHRDRISALAFSPDNRALVSGCADSTLRVWELTRPETCRRYQGHKHQILSVAWSPDGQSVVSSDGDGPVLVWDPWRQPAGSGASEFPAPVYYHNFRLSADGTRAILLEPTNRMAVLWDMVKLQPTETFDFAGTNLNRFAWSPDDRWLATSPDSITGNIIVWDLTNRRARTALAHPGLKPAYLEFTSNGRFLFCGGFRGGGWEREAKLWDWSNAREITLPREAMTHLTWAHVSPDCRFLVVLHSNGTLDVWDVASGRCLAPRLSQPFASPEEEGYVAFSPNGRIWASSTQWGALALWNVAEKKRPLVVIPRTAQELWDLSFSADGTRLVVSGRRSADVVRLLDLGSKRFVATLPGKPDVYWYSRMSADSSTVYAVGEKTVLLWRAPSWAEIEAAEKREVAP